MALGLVKRVKLANGVLSCPVYVMEEEKVNPLQYRGMPVHLTLRRDAVAINIRAWKLQLAYHEEVKAQLNNMEKDAVIEAVTEPSEWCLPLLVKKPNGKLRLCIDPQCLNKYLRREVFPLPSLAELTSQLSEAKWFSVLDLHWGFWQLSLDKESSWMCTFSTPFGRFRFKRLPFGVSPAPEIFHQIVQ